MELAREYMDLLPPRRKEFQDVMTPHSPPSRTTLASASLLNASLMASADTRPVSAMDVVI